MRLEGLLPLSSCGRQRRKKNRRRLAAGCLHILMRGRRHKRGRRNLDLFCKLHGQGGMGPRENKCSFIPAMDELSEPKTCVAL